DAPPFLVLHQERLYLNLGLCLDVAAGLPGVTPADAEALLLGGARGEAAGGARVSPLALVRAGPRMLGVARRALRDNARLRARIASAEARLSLLAPVPTT